MPEEAKIPPFPRHMPLILTRAPNGGWTIEGKGALGEMNMMLGAFSNVEDMLVALQSALAGNS